MSQSNADRAKEYRSRCSPVRFSAGGHRSRVRRAHGQLCVRRSSLQRRPGRSYAHDGHLGIARWFASGRSVQGYGEGRVNLGVTPVEVKEIVYQATPYVGMGRMLPFLYAVNELLEHRLVELPLEGQATTTEETRLEAGAQKRWTYSGRRWPIFTSRAPRRRATSTVGWPRIASATTTRARVWTTRSARWSRSASSPRAAASRRRSAMPRQTCAWATIGRFDQSGVAVSALHRLSAQLERSALHRRGAEAMGDGGE